MNTTGHIEIYQTEDGQPRIEMRLDRNTLWLSRAQMAELFEKDSDTISLHLRNIYAEGELDEAATTEESPVVRQEGKRQVRRNIRFYDLDAVISVGYRVNSKKGTQLRIWATQRLRELLVQGYSINQQRLEQNAAELEQALALIRRTARSPELNTAEGRGLIEIIGRYTQTFLWLQRYDGDCRCLRIAERRISSRQGDRRCTKHRWSRATACRCSQCHGSERRCTAGSC